jgi:hypothetical protein
MNCKTARTEQEYHSRNTDCLRTEGATDLSLFPNIQTGSRVRSAYCSVVPDFFSGVKRQGRELYHSPSSSAEHNNEWSYTSIPPIFLHGVDMANFALKEKEESDCGLVKR